MEKNTQAQNQAVARAKESPNFDKVLGTLLDKQQEVAATLDTPIFVAAGAGSGKTFTLTRRIVWALTEGSGEGGAPFLDSIDQILVITYTNRAAGEIKERVRSALRLAGLNSEALKVDSAWISTIHGMCGRILRENALDLGLDPNFVMLPAEKAAIMRTRAVNSALKEFAGTEELSAVYGEYGVSLGKSRKTDVAGILGQIIEIANATPGGFDALRFVDTDIDYNACITELEEAYAELCEHDPKDPSELELCKASLERVRAYNALSPASRTPEAATTMLLSLHAPEYTAQWKPVNNGPLCTATTNALKASNAAVSYARLPPLHEPLLQLAKKINARFEEYKKANSCLDNNDLLRLAALALDEHPEIAARYTNKFKLVMVDEFQDTNDRQITMIKKLSGNGKYLTTVGDSQQSIYRFQGAEVQDFINHGKTVATHVELAKNFRSDDAILRFVKRVCSDTGFIANFMDLVPDADRETSFVKGPEAEKVPLEHPRVVVELMRAGTVKANKEDRSKPDRLNANSELRTRLAAEQLADRLARLRAEGIEPRRMAVLMRSLSDSAVYIDALQRRGIESVVTGGSTFRSLPEVQVVRALLHYLANPKDTQSGLFPVLESPMFALDANDMLVLATRLQDKSDGLTKCAIDKSIVFGMQQAEAAWAAQFEQAAAGEAAESAEAVEDAASAAPVETTPAQPAASAAPVRDVYAFGAYESERLTCAREVLGRALSRVGKLEVADILLACLRESSWLARLESAGTQGASTAANLLAAVNYVRTISEEDGFNPITSSQLFDAWLEDAREHPVVLAGKDSNAVRFMTAHASKGLEFDVVAVVGCAEHIDHGAPAVMKWDSKTGPKLSLKPNFNGIQSPTYKRETVEIPESASPFVRRCELELERKNANELEDGRLLYVALTRAKECVILVLDTNRTATGALSPKMSGDIAKQLNIAKAPVGESLFEVDAATNCTGLVRCCELICQDDGHTHFVSTGGTITGIATAWYPARVDAETAKTELAAQLKQHKVDENEPDFNETDWYLEAPADPSVDPKPSAPVTFDIYNIETQTQAKPATWHMREGVFSFSGVHKALAAADPELTLDDILTLPAPEPPSAFDEARAEETPAFVPELLKNEKKVDGRKVEEYSATDYGNAFHELGRFMVEMGRTPTDGEVNTTLYNYVPNASRTVKERLVSELTRWENSAVRQEVLAYPELRAEVPFFCEVESELGHNLEGFIDLLATDGKERALLIDYKTGYNGYTYSHLREYHEMQARFYTYILKLQGYKKVTCKFVHVDLVEGATSSTNLKAGEGEPATITYEF